MKAFWIYTLARIGVFVVVYAIVWGIASIWYDISALNLFVLIVAAVLSSVISIVVLGRLRDDLARHVEERATRIADRIEESRRAEDVD